MAILSVIVAITIIFIIVGNSASKKQQKDLDSFNKKNNIPTNSKFITCIELNEMELNTQLNGVVAKGKAFSIWKEDNSINLCKTLYSNNKINEVVKKITIPINSIKFFARDGEYRVDNIVEGGGISLGGAIVGGVVAGGVGAILGGRTKVTTTTKEVDKRLTYLYYNEDNQEKRIVLDSKDYNILSSIIPNKDYSYIEKNNIVSN